MHHFRLLRGALVEDLMLPAASSCDAAPQEELQNQGPQSGCGWLKRAEAGKDEGWELLLMGSPWFESRHSRRHCRKPPLFPLNPLRLLPMLLDELY